MQDDARAGTICSRPESVVETPLCSYKDTDCDYWPLDEARYRKRIAWFAVLPIVLGWLAAYGAAGRRWRKP